MSKHKTSLSSINHFLHLWKMSDSNLVTDCILQNRANFGMILNSKLDFSDLIAILKLLVHVYNAELELTKNDILRMTLSQAFIDNIRYYLTQYDSAYMKENKSGHKEELTLFVLYFDAIVNVLPLSNEFYTKFVSLLELLLDVIFKIEFEKLPMRYWIEELILLVKNKNVHIDRKSRSYKNMNIYPSPVDFFEEIELQPKKLTYKFNTIEEYLDMQFKVLKLDYESVVREGIRQLKREFRGADKNPNSLINIYEDVTVDSIEVDSNYRHGVLHVITFSIEDEEKLEENWSSENKNFMNGSLLYFSSCSQFTTFVIARVVDGNDTTVDNNGDECKALRVSIVGPPSSLQVGKKYFMIEPTTFFEPYFQVLKAIQSIKPDKYFAKKYISDLNFSMLRPSYLQESISYTIGSEDINNIDTSVWPTVNLNLNESQSIALQAAITNEFVLIQGPPGTGKTHLVKAIINTLILNKKYRSSPIFLVCARNDSLDNVLESLIQAQFKVVRLGGQTKSAVVKDYELSKMNMNLTNKKKLTSKIQGLKIDLAEKIEEGGKTDYLHSSLEMNISYYIKLCEVDAAKGIISSNVDLVGATTTGAARLHYLMSLVKPEVVIIEEAAEVLEAHVVAAIPAGCKHVIMIGDHKQLQPTPAHVESAEKYNMHISLFERLVHCGMKCFKLNEQYRMRPEIASLVCPLIYENLKNHPSVLEYPDIKGISKNLYFINHRHPEGKTSEHFGRWNKHEADLLLALAYYLTQQGYPTTDITVLTGYSAQVTYLNQAKANFPALENLKVSSIDNYQGQENLIILLSLVRSESSTIGFLKKSFRVNVALSRAKHGLYIVGNMKTISSQSQLWQYIKHVLEQLKCIGENLPLECQTHKTISYVKTPKDILKRKYGGCKLRCELTLSCGHLCQRVCHPLIEEHENYICKEQCLRLPCGEHQCKSFCYEECKVCTETVIRELPCGHKMKMKCQTNINDIVCRNPCNRMPCGQHKCKLLCHEKCVSCAEITNHKLDCGHTITAPCSTEPRSIICKMPCNRICANGHHCGKLCHEECGPCLTPRTIVYCFCIKKEKPCLSSKFTINLTEQI